MLWHDATLSKACKFSKYKPATSAHQMATNTNIPRLLKPLDIVDPKHKHVLRCRRDVKQLHLAAPHVS